MYCARGQMENFIKLHKTQLRSDRTGCRSPLANQVRLVLHTAAYRLLLPVRDHIPKAQPLAVAEFCRSSNTSAHSNLLMIPLASVLRRAIWNPTLLPPRCSSRQTRSAEPAG
jgi:hypothetical protein